MKHGILRLAVLSLVLGASSAAMAQRSTDLKPGQQERHYDSLNRPTGRTERSSSGEYRQYDNLNRLQGTSRQNRDGSRTNYDSLHRPTSRSERR